MTLLPKNVEPSDPTPLPPRLELSALAERARTALAQGKTQEAIVHLRQAIRIAPFRPDLREMLSAALEDRAGVNRTPSEPAPEPIRTSTRPPLFQNVRPPVDPFDETPAQPVRIEEIRFDRGEPQPATPTPVPVSVHEWPMPRGRRTIRPRDASAAAAPARRRMRRPRRAAWVYVVGAGVALSLVVGAMAMIFRGDDSTTVEKSEPVETPAAAAARQNQVVIEQAERYLNQNQFTLGIQQLESLTDGADKNRRLAEAYERQGRLYATDKNYNDARKSFEKALDYSPQNEEYTFETGWNYYLLANTQRKENKKNARETYAQAEKFFKQTLEVNPSSIKAMDGLAHVAIKRDDRQAAEQYCRRILSIDPNSMEGKNAKRALEAWGLK